MHRSTLSNFALLFLRVSFSGLLLTHGVPKLIKLFSGDHAFADPIGTGALVALILAVLGEVVFPLFVIIGYKTRWMAIPVIITMGVAAFVFHAPDPFSSKEKALLYFCAFIAIALLGAGRFSIDGRTGR